LLECSAAGWTTAASAIDMIEFSGIEFRQVDNRLMSMKLVQVGLSGAAMFAPDGTVLSARSRTLTGFRPSREGLRRASPPTPDAVQIQNADRVPDLPRRATAGESAQPRRRS